MKFSKIKFLSALCLLVACLVVYAINSTEVKADAVKTQQGTMIRTTSLVSDKVIKIPVRTTVQTANGGASVSASTANRGSVGNVYNSGSSSGAGNQVVAYAYTLIGRPYVWGAAGPKAFDCSGLAMYVYAHFGVSLPHFSGAQFGRGQAVNKSDLRPGDLVFFNTYSSVSHVGIYIGGGNFIHAPGTGSRVTISSLYEGYFQKSYAGARRYIK